MNPTKEELRSGSVRVKNCRQYFSEDAMREREPYLHHEYVGRFQDLSGRSMAWPGERWSETLMRRSEEAMLIARIRKEQWRQGVAEADWVGYERYQKQQGEEEEEEEEDEVEEVKRAGGSVHPAEMLVDHPAENDSTCPATTEQIVEIVSAEDMQDGMDQFTYIMLQKFLSGEDHQYLDYSKIDEDETLDDHWLGETNHDAEEKCFAKD